jgi:hypothetical protein
MVRVREATYDNTMGRMPIACWNPNGIDTFTICHADSFPRQKSFRQRASVLHLYYIACLVYDRLEIRNQAT